MAVAVDVAGSSVNFQSASPVSNSSLITVGASASLLIVGVTFDNGTSGGGPGVAPTSPAVTWGGTSMTLISNTTATVGTWAANTFAASTYLFGLVSPASGTQTISLSWGNNTTSYDGYIVAISFTGSATGSVATACPNGTHGTGTTTTSGTASWSSPAVTTATGDFVVAVSSDDSGNAFTLSASAGTTVLDNENNGQMNLWSAYSTSGASGASVTLSGTVNSAAGPDSYATSAVNISAGGFSATNFTDSAPTLGIPALAIVTPLVLGGFTGNATSSGPVLDFGLNRLHANANVMTICSTVPTTYVQATTTFALGNVTPGAGTLFGTMSNGVPTGRIVNSVAITAGTVTTTGTPNSWAVVDTVNADLLMTGTATGFSAVTSGQTWQLGSFDVHMFNS